MKSPFLRFTALIALSLSLASCSKEAERGSPAPLPQAEAKCGLPSRALEPSEKLITILGTNDLHGAILPKTTKEDVRIGGLAFWAGAVGAVRKGLAERYGENAGLLVLDGGDQFQGTLLSNYSEGRLMFDLMNTVGYDAVVPGNHDYDFGPWGWLVDQVTPGTGSQNPREVIEDLAKEAKFPLLSANTYLKASLKTIEGRVAEVKSVGCETSDLVDWSNASRPSFLKPYLIKSVAGVRVAMIGIDNPETPLTTTAANVSDLCFRDPLVEYRAIREELEGKADIFVMLTHNGDIKEDKNLSVLMEKILEWRSDALDAVVGGHTHTVNFIQRKGVYGIQSGANGQQFGRIDLVFDTAQGKVVRKKTQALAGAMLYHDRCADRTTAFCRAETELQFECQNVSESSEVQTQVAQALESIQPLLGKNLGSAKKTLTKDRDTESPLLNFLTDTYRNASGADITFLNTGGVRTNIEKGPFLYENLFALSPFNNRAVILAPMGVETILKIMERSAQSCGRSGAVLASGIRVEYTRADCKQFPEGVDPNARIVKIEDSAGEVVYDARDVKNVVVSPRTFRVATLDFLAAGGSGYTAFKDFPVVTDLGIFRELIAEELSKEPKEFSAEIDGRFKNVSKGR